MFGLVLLAGVTALFVTGLLSYAAYNPDLGNDTTPDKGLLGFYLFDWPTHPAWLYRLTQGVHVTLGVVLIPVLLAKLWSVIPKLFDWPPVRSPAQALPARWWGSGWLRWRRCCSSSPSLPWGTCSTWSLAGTRPGPGCPCWSPR
ncbi:hypothetical protein [Dactylosporangium sp. CA-139066]|uniref:hypothetical protein n=1 Tax=Dactylosporangium sp. CA-139066 TaxID=3239930 RepID=UPI003D89DF33